MTRNAPVALREMAAADIPAGLRLCRASGWNQTARDWEQFLELKPHGARVAVRAGSVVGTVTTVDYEDRFGWIGMVLVDPVARGQGVGTQLLQKGIELLEGIGCARLDATPAGHGLYLKLGFKDEYGLARMQRLPGVAAPASTPTPDARAMTSRDLPKVAAFDREVFGADRSAMLSWLLAGAPEYARVIERAGELRAHSFGRHGHDFEHLGPVVARDLVAARQLAAACIAAAPERSLVIDATLHDVEWRRWLEAQGFREQRPFFRMFKGALAHPGLPERQFAIVGPEFG